MTRLAAAAIIAALAGGEAVAQSYAAIAFSQASGAYGYYHRADTLDAAEEGALQECGPGCEIVIWARDACAGLAVGEGNGYGHYWSVDEDAAVNGALAACDEYTTNCELEVMICSAY